MLQEWLWNLCSWLREAYGFRHDYLSWRLSVSQDDYILNDVPRLSDAHALRSIRSFTKREWLFLYLYLIRYIHVIDSGTQAHVFCRAHVLQKLNVSIMFFCHGWDSLKSTWVHRSSRSWVRLRESYLYLQNICKADYIMIFFLWWIGFLKSTWVHRSPRSWARLRESSLYLQNIKLIVHVFFVLWMGFPEKYLSP